MSPYTRRLLTLCLVITLGSPVVAAADEPIPEAVLSFTRTLTGTADPNAVRATPVREAALEAVAADCEHVAALDLTRGPALSPADVAPECSLVALDAGYGRRRCYVRADDCLISIESADLSDVGDAIVRVRRLARECREAKA